ncbi:amidase [Amnibacterium sp. CER49]|uniref:amidase n=1 Tax=Amnibacterium sp. CER49 TaxID=3039161 RepID=UPI00244AF3CC|nr:amidase [Amnibacterium sp. CER49]MDH2445229.1 amidase [Amnibacterium sp. CER49]
MVFALHHLSAQEQWDWVHRGDATVVELVEHALGRIAELDPRLGAFARVDGDRARERAAALDATGPGAAPLAGVPTAEKELARRAGTRSGSGSRLLADAFATRSDRIVDALDATGAVSLGATTSPEFGLTGFSEPAGRAPVRNPWDVSLGAGGSSGGAAAAVAAGLVAFAVGSDGGGSVRIPAASCGVVGLKPTRGLVPAQGGQDSFAGLVSAGPIARTVADAAMVLDALADPTGRRRRPVFATAPPTDRDAGPLLGAAIRGEGRFSVGVLRSSVWDDAVDIRIDPECAGALDRAVAAIADLDHGLEEVALPGERYPELFRVLWQASAAAIPASTPEELALLEPYTRAVLERGRALPVPTVLEALAAAAAFERRTIAAFDPFDVVLTPALALPPMPLGWFTFDPDPDVVFDRQVQAAPFSSFVNVAGLPAVTVPVGATDTGRPAGVQLIGRPGGEAAMLSLARQLERRFGWPHRHPPAFW